MVFLSESVYKLVNAIDIRVYLALFQHYCRAASLAWTKSSVNCRFTKLEVHAQQKIKHSWWRGCLKLTYLISSRNHSLSLGSLALPQFQRTLPPRHYTVEHSTAAHSTVALYPPVAALLAAPRPLLPTSNAQSPTSSWRAMRSLPSTLYEGRWRSRRGLGRRIGSALPPLCRRLRGRAILRTVCKTEIIICEQWEQSWIFEVVGMWTVSVHRN